MPGGGEGAVGVFGLFGEATFGVPDGWVVVAGGCAFTAAGGRLPGAQLELALLMREQGGPGEGIVLTFDAQLPAQHDHLRLSGDALKQQSSLRCPQQ